MPALLAVTAVLLWLIGLGVTHARVDEAAFAAARLAARGGSDDAVRSQVSERLPGATVYIVGTTDTVTVTVSQRTFAGVPVLSGLDFPIAVSAEVAREAM